jgi:PAS domain S-box-containing protein
VLSVRRRRFTLRAHLLVLVALYIAAAGAGVGYGWVQADRDARANAVADATFGAKLAATELATGIRTMRDAVAQIVATPNVMKTLAEVPGSCSLSLSLDGGPDSAHIDVLTDDGAVACSSRKSAGDYRTAPWLAAAKTGPQLQAPVADPRVGGMAVVFTGPIPGGGIVAGFINLDLVGPLLTGLFGGPHRLEFLVTTSDGGTVLARSVEATRWVGKTTTGTPFHPSGPGEHRDLTGIRREYGEVTVPEAGWRVYAGAALGQSLAASRRLAVRESAIIAVGLFVALAATLLVYRRITRPIGRLRQAVRDAAGAGDGGVVETGGPAEVAELAQEFNDLTAAVERELNERRLAEDAAREMEHNYRQLFDGNPYPTCVLAADTLELLDVNEAAIAHYGYSRDEFLRRTMADLGPAEDGPALTQAMANAATIDVVGPLRQYTSKGTMIEVNVVSHALSVGGRKVRCAVIEDVTARAQLERRLQQSQRLESLGQLAGGVAHDFNNLLNVIVGYSSLAVAELAEAAASDPHWQGVHDDVAQIQGAVDRATTLTRQLLAFARAEVVQARALDLNRVVTDIEQLLRRTLGDDVRLATRYAAEPVPVYIDPGQLEQVLVNLAVNARDAMPGGGELTIETGMVVLDEYSAGQQPGRYARLRVADTGTGMNQDTVDRAFEPFFTTKTKGPGTGLGLATIYGIVTSAGGDVQIDSEVGRGTTITVLLPWTDRPLVSDQPATFSARPGNGETILLVEDEPSLRAVNERILTAGGYRVLVAEDGLAALDVAARGDHLDLLVTDVMMPHMSGPDLADRLRETRPDLPVIYVSGYAEPILNMRNSLPAGITLLTKPVTAEQLLDNVRDVLDT